MFTECAEMDPFFGGIMILPLIYCILGYVSGTLSQKVLASNLPSFMVYVMVGGVIEGLCRFGLTAIRISTLPPWHYLIGSFLPRFILTIVFSPVIYLLLKTGKKKLDKI